MHTTNYDTFFNSQQYSTWSCALRTFQIASMFLHFCFISFYFYYIFCFYGLFSSLHTSYYRTYFVLSSALCQATLSNFIRNQCFVCLHIVAIVVVVVVVHYHFFISCFSYKTVRGSYALLCVAEKQIPHEFIGGCSKEKGEKKWFLWNRLGLRNTETCMLSSPLDRFGMAVQLLFA